MALMELSFLTSNDFAERGTFEALPIWVYQSSALTLKQARGRSGGNLNGWSCVKTPNYRGGFVPHRAEISPLAYLSQHHSLAPCARYKPCCHGEQRMRGFRRADEIAKNGPWICHRCLRGRRKPNAQLAAYTTKPGKPPLWTFSAHTASQTGRSSYESAALKDSVLERRTSNSLSSNGPISKESVWKKVLVLKGKRRGLILATLAIGSIWAFSDDAKHRYVALKRALRVFSALVRCLREYYLPSVILPLYQFWSHS